MPEGNTVWLTARTLRSALARRRLTVAQLRVADLVELELTGQTVLDVAARGKHLLIRVNNGLTLHSHLRMDGNWRVFPASSRPGRAALQPDANDHVRVALGNDTSIAVGTRVHDLAVVPTDREHELVGHLGPDLLGPDWDAAEAVRRLASDPLRPVGEAILDQRNLAGAGNVYKNEACFLRGISPWTPITDINGIDALVDLLRRLLVANRDRYDHVTTGSTKRGEHLWVYGRSGEPCRRCGAPISREFGDGAEDRISYWCPRCQPGPTPPADQRRPERAEPLAGRHLRPATSN